MEIWKPVLGYETFYEVSNKGNVRRTARGKLFSAEQVKTAKIMFSNGAKLREVAVFLNTSITTASAIKNEKTWRGDENFRLVNPRPDRQNYMIVDLCVAGVFSKRRVHRLVWEAFNGPILGRLEINHKNLIREDNRLENLEILSHRENIQHAQNIYRKERAHLPKGQRAGPKSKYAKIKHT
jgi:hypothetical protein